MRSGAANVRYWALADPPLTPDAVYDGFNTLRQRGGSRWRRAVGHPEKQRGAPGHPETPLDHPYRENQPCGVSTPVASTDASAATLSLS